jgi:Flp pilus assembly protein TadB
MLSTIDTVAVSFAICSLLFYNISVYSTVFVFSSSNPQLAKIMNNAFYWMIKHQSKDDPASVQCAVHTLRNTIFVAVFIGGAAVHLGLSFTDDFKGGDDLTPLQIRALVLAILCFFSFLCWMLVIRFSAQLSFLIGTLNIPHVTVDAAEVSRNKQESHQIESKTRNSEDEGMSTAAKDKQLSHCVNLLRMSSIFFR